MCPEGYLPSHLTAKAAAPKTRLARRRAGRAVRGHSVADGLLLMGIEQARIAPDFFGLAA